MIHWCSDETSTVMLALPTLLMVLGVAKTWLRRQAGTLYRCGLQVLGAPREDHAPRQEG